MDISYNIKSELEAKVQEICRRFNLQRQFEYVRDKNPSNGLPYHNWYHTLCMVEKCIEGANYHNLPFRSIRNLAAAALFHDFNHSGGKADDATNIHLALAGFRSLHPHLYIDEFEIEQLICVTEYPYVIEPVCIEQRIIRDADLMQVLRLDTWEEMVIHGLQKEIEVKLGKKLSVVEMCEGQIKFLSNATAKSDWGYSVMFDSGELLHAIDRIRMLSEEKKIG